MNKLRKKNILIISEGYEEKPYIDKILSFPNIDEKTYNFSKSINVKGCGNIPAKYQFEIQRGFYDVILIFCDADKGKSNFATLVNKIGEEFFINKKSGIEVFIFANPVTLQVVLSHFGDVCLKNVGKKSNAKIVEKLTGIKNYNAEQSQISAMVSKIHFNSLDSFKKRLKLISKDPKVIPSTNFLTFLERFENSDTVWIDNINKLRK